MAAAEQSLAVTESLAGSTPANTSAPADELQQAIERTGAAFEEACVRVEEVNARIAESEERIAEVQQRIDELNGQIPIQQGKSDRAVSSLYKLQKQTGSMTDFILSAESFSEFIDAIEYVKSVSDLQASEVGRLDSLKNQHMAARSALGKEKAQVQADRLAAVAAARSAADALQAAKDARAQAQREAAARAEALSGGAVNPDGADWGTDADGFVEQWAGRIDAYLAGSPLEGQGAAFARAAWRYGIDPRFSPAISNTESSKGRFCIKPHNAWGWGAADTDPSGLAFSWNSWEEAIDAHVRGLARGYGYTISVAGAQKYCPVNWEHWYSNTAREMNAI